MIKNIAYFPLQSAKNSPPVLDAMIKGLISHNIKPIENSMHADAVLLWSVLWHGRMSANQQVYNHYRAQNKPVVVIDIGALYRGTTWKVAVDNVNARGHYGHTENLDWDRPRKLGIALAEVLLPDPHIIVAAQHKNSLQVEDISSVENWISNKITELRAFTDRPIVVRPHPRSRLDLTQLPTDIQIQTPRRVADTYDNFDMHFNCHAVVNHNSGPGIQAAISGVRPIVDDSSLAHPVSISVQDIEKPYDVDREKWLVEICHTEYTLDEIRRGEWIRRVSGKLAA